MRTVVSRCFLWCFGLLLSSFSSVAVAADTPCAKVKHRPCVALVLGGGGARGGAHVGVLKELERLQIPVDLIVGTSIGAYVGGLYALGHTPAEIENMMRKTAWGQGFRDRVERDEMPMRRKQQRDEFPINLDLGLDSSGFKLPKGVLHGQAMAALIQQAYGVVPEFASFDALPIPFRAVATDLANRDTVVLAEGSLLLAVQASMSIPGVVRPMEINNRWLVDGGVANNLPISVAKSLGADRVIAVAIDAPLLQQQQLDSAMAITEQLTSFLVREAVERQLTLLGPEDVLLQPALAKIGTLDFAQIDVAIDAGQQVAKQAARQLTAFSQPEHYASWRQQHQLQDHSRMQLADVVLDNRTGLADELLLQRLGLSPQQKLNSTELTKALRRVYGLDTLERISSSLIRTEDGQQQLKLQALPKSWGPAYLNFRFQLEDDFSNTHNYQIAASYLWTELSVFGAEWQTDLALGSDKLFKTQLYWPLADSGFYTAARMQQSRTLLGLENSIGLSDGELNNTEFQFGAELGFHPLDNANLSFGLVQRDGYYRFPAAIASQFNVGTLSYLRRGVETSLVVDTLDQLSFPTRGYKFQGSLQRLQDNVLGGRSHSHSSLLRAETATRFGAHIWHGRVRWDNFSGADGTVALEQFTLGGLLNLSGYPKNYLFGSQIRFGSMVYLYQLSDSRLSFFNAPFYLGASLERGMVTEPRFGDRSLAQHDQWLWAGSVFAGWDSPFGPLYLGYGQAESGPQEKPYRFYLSLGQTF